MTSTFIQFYQPVRKNPAVSMELKRNQSQTTESHQYKLSRSNTRKYKRDSGPDNLARKFGRQKHTLGQKKPEKIKPTLMEEKEQMETIDNNDGEKIKETVDTKKSKPHRKDELNMGVPNSND